MGNTNRSKIFISGADMGKLKGEKEKDGVRAWSVSLAVSIPTCSDRFLKFNALQSPAWAWFYVFAFFLMPHF